MLGSKEITGLVLDGNAIKVARIAVTGKKLRLLKLDQFSLVEAIQVAHEIEESSAFDEGNDFGEELDADSIFGLDDEDEAESHITMGDDDGDDEISFDDLAGEPDVGDTMALDMVEEAGGAQTNQILLFNILSGLDSKKVNLGINIPAGNAIFQIIRDTDFNEVKKKDLIVDLEGKLESIYGVSKSKDNYAYEVRDDGSLILASVDSESPLLHLLNQALELYNGKAIVEEVFPDEVILSGLVRANYDFAEHEITAVIQFGSQRCRIVFMRGNDILQVSPLINEGTQDNNFLNTVFSKILFQLDTGEVSNLDRIIIANNTLGEEATSFFKKNFSDIPVSNFQFDDSKINTQGVDQSIVRSFTTAIGMAWGASGVDKKIFPELSLLPEYVIDRQKTFRLQWHGVLMLLLIFASPITFNYYYQQNVSYIDELSSDIEQTTNQIAQIQPVVESTNQLTEDLELLREKLVLLGELSEGSKEWSIKLNILNEGLNKIKNTWLTSLSPTQAGMYIDGYTLYRNRIPRVVNIFSDATLLNVSIQEEREKEIYKFSISIKEFTDDKSVYSPAVPEELEEVIGN